MARKKDTTEEVVDGSVPLKNNKHELFCNLAVADTNGKAYQMVYDPECKDKVVSAHHRVNASKLLTKANIKARYDYLIKQYTDNAHISVKERLATVSRNLEKAEEEGNHTAINAYLNTISKMLGEDVSRIDMTSSSDITVTKNDIKEVMEDFDGDF